MLKFGDIRCQQLGLELAIGIGRMMNFGISRIVFLTDILGELYKVLSELRLPILIFGGLKIELLRVLQQLHLLFNRFTEQQIEDRLGEIAVQADTVRMRLDAFKTLQFSLA